MTLDRFNAVKRAAKRAGVKCRNYSKTPEPTYSGRGMFGRTTQALVVYRYDIGDFEEAIKRKLGRQTFADLRIDNLGLDYIVY